jgi:hypothetical protein
MRLSARMLNRAYYVSASNCRKVLPCSYLDCLFDKLSCSIRVSYYSLCCDTSTQYHSEVKTNKHYLQLALSLHVVLLYRAWLLTNTHSLMLRA